MLVLLLHNCLGEFPGYRVFSGLTGSFVGVVVVLWGRGGPRGRRGRDCHWGSSGCLNIRFNACHSRDHRSFRRLSNASHVVALPPVSRPLPFDFRLGTVFRRPPAHCRVPRRPVQLRDHATRPLGVEGEPGGRAQEQRPEGELEGRGAAASGHRRRGTRRRRRRAAAIHHHGCRGSGLTRERGRVDIQGRERCRGQGKSRGAVFVMAASTEWK